MGLGTLEGLGLEVVGSCLKLKPCAVQLLSAFDRWRVLLAISGSGVARCQATAAAWGKLTVVVRGGFKG